MACIVFTCSIEGPVFSETFETKKRIGRIIRKDEATKNIAIPHPIVPIRTVAIGAPANIPAEAAAVPRPIIKLLCFASTTLPSATITTGKEHAPVPIPTIKPVKINRVSSKKMPRKAKPRAANIAPKANTRVDPCLSAYAPAIGCVMPHISAWIARDSENTSRPQPKSADIGLRKTLNEAENPKLTNEITQPAIIA